MKETSKTYNKKVIALAIGLMLWPILLYVFTILPIYALVGTTGIDGKLDPDVDRTLAIGRVAAPFLYLGLPSFLGGVVLLAMKGRK